MFSKTKKIQIFCKPNHVCAMCNMILYVCCMYISSKGKVSIQTELSTPPFYKTSCYLYRQETFTVHIKIPTRKNFFFLTETSSNFLGMNSSFIWFLKTKLNVRQSNDTQMVILLTKEKLVEISAAYTDVCS